MDWPRLNLLAPPCLHGLCYRALAGAADPTVAPLTQRRIEHVQATETELVKQLSSARGDAAIFTVRTTEARKLRQQATLDLQLFNESHPAQPAVRSLLKPKRTVAELETETQRLEYERLVVQAETDCKIAEAQAAATVERVQTLEAQLSEIRAIRAGYQRELSEELAAHVLSLGAAGDWAQAKAQLADTRQLVRGDLMVAVLIVVTALLEHGPAALRAALLELSPLFEQHPDPLPRVLEALGALVGGSPLSARGVSIYQAAQFSQAAHWRLYQLLRVLAGWPPERTNAGDPFEATLWALNECRLALDSTPGQTPSDAAELARWSAGTDLVVRLLCTHALALRGAVALIPPAAGVDLAAIQPPAKRGEEWPALLPLLAPAPTPAWPVALDEPWRAALCCHVLVAAQDLAPAALFEKWLAESYGWPKSDLYWWTLAQLKQDGSLRRNITGAPGELFIAN